MTPVEPRVPAAGAEGVAGGRPAAGVVAPEVRRRGVPVAVSLDLDDRWAYLRSRGDPAWAAAPTVLERVVPRFVALCRAARVRATVFVVGRDLERQAVRAWMECLVEAGHELASHGHEHDLAMGLRPTREIEADVARAEAAIAAVWGRRPEGFRAPGYRWTPALREVLERRGYRYDASPWPTPVEPLARGYLRILGGAGGMRRAERVGGGWRGAFASLRVRREGALWVVPVTTVPGVRVPLHPSWLQLAARFSATAGRAWLAAGLRACRAAALPVSLVFHPTDLLGRAEAPDLRFLPGMDVVPAAKLRFASDVLAAAVRTGPAGTVTDLVAEVARRGGEDFR